jgi:uncharacterized membrane protein YtjA (UPF0391 family)
MQILTTECGFCCLEWRHGLFLKGKRGWPATCFGRNCNVSVQNERGHLYMLNWAIAFLLLAILAAVLGFAGFAFVAAGFAKALFLIFMVLFLVFLVGHISRKA